MIRITEEDRAIIRACNVKHRRDMVFSLSRQGLSIPEIAKQLGIRHKVAKADLETVYDLAGHELASLVKREVSIQLVRLDYLYEQAMNAWHNSCDPSLEVIDKTETERDGPEVLLETGEVLEDGSPAMLDVSPPRTGKSKHTRSSRSINAHGDPRFLTEARNIMAARQKLLGLENPERHQVEQIVRITEDRTLNVSVVNQEVTGEHMSAVAKLIESMGLGKQLIPGYAELPAPKDELETEGEFQEDASEIVPVEEEAGEGEGIGNNG